MPDQVVWSCRAMFIGRQIQRPIHPRRPEVFRDYDQQPVNQRDQADLDFILEGMPRK